MVEAKQASLGQQAAPASSFSQIVKGFQQAAPQAEPEPAACYTKGKDLLVPTITSEKPETTRCEA